MNLTPSVDVVALCGSLRRGSFNRLLLRAAAQHAPAGMRIEIVDGLEAIPLFNEDLERETAGGPENVRRLRERVGSADGLLIATPEYNHSIPGALKNTIDWLSRGGPEPVLTRKPVAIVGASGGPWGTRLAQAALRQVLYATESAVLPGPALFVREAERLFDESGALVDERTRRTLDGVMTAFAHWIARVQ
jgi:chromate reductase